SSPTGRSTESSPGTSSRTTRREVLAKRAANREPSGRSAEIGGGHQSARIALSSAAAAESRDAAVGGATFGETSRTGRARRREPAARSRGGGSGGGEIRTRKAGRTSERANALESLCRNGLRASRAPAPAPRNDPEKPGFPPKTRTGPGWSGFSFAGRPTP